MFSAQLKIVSLFVNILDFKSVFAAELKEPKIRISGKGLTGQKMGTHTQIHRSDLVTTILHRLAWVKTYLCMHLNRLFTAHNLY